jgi:hypothetical protein
MPVRAVGEIVMKITSNTVKNVDEWGYVDIRSRKILLRFSSSWFLDPTDLSALNLFRGTSRVNRAPMHYLLIYDVSSDYLERRRIRTSTSLWRGKRLNAEN